MEANAFYPNAASPSPDAASPGKLIVSNVDPNILRPNPANARRHTKKQIKQIATSIQTFGFVVPILIDAGKNVLAGHGRLLAAQKLGLTSVPVIRIDHLTEAQARAFVIADNRLTEIGGWDGQRLALELKALSELRLDFDVEITGFDAPQIDILIAGLDKPADAATKEEPLPSISGPPVTRSGDLWRLGRHKLLCGSALEASSFGQLFGCEQASAIFTDPPFNVAIDGNVSGRGGVRHREFAMGAGELNRDQFTEFLKKSLGHSAQSAKPGALIYVFMDWRHLSEVQTAAHDLGLVAVNLCVWTKPNAGMGSFYRSQHELVFVFKNGSARHLNNIELGRHGRNRTNVWAYANGPGFGRAGEEGRLAALHPTVKPVPLVADALLDCSRRGDIVLDPFLGSGATLIAAERTGRRCYGVEIDPLYCDVAIRRWQAHTGEAARHAFTGVAFDEAEGAKVGGVALR